MVATSNAPTGAAGKAQSLLDTCDALTHGTSFEPAELIRIIAAQAQAEAMLAIADSIDAMVETVKAAIAARPPFL